MTIQEKTKLIQDLATHVSNGFVYVRGDHNYTQVVFRLALFFTGETDKIDGTPAPSPLSGQVYDKTCNLPTTQLEAKFNLPKGFLKSIFVSSIMLENYGVKTPVISQALVTAFVKLPQGQSLISEYANLRQQELNNLKTGLANVSWKEWDGSAYCDVIHKSVMTEEKESCYIFIIDGKKVKKLKSGKHLRVVFL